MILESIHSISRIRYTLYAKIGKLVMILRIFYFLNIYILYWIRKVKI